MTFRKVIGFGDALRLEATTAPGGLKAAVDRIHTAVGRGIGVRNTFAKLFDLADVPTDEGERERAYLLLLALGQDPADWELGEVRFPPAINQESLRDLVISASRCTGHLVGAAA